MTTPAAPGGGFPTNEDFNNEQTKPYAAIDHGRPAYLFEDEKHFFVKWLALPHPDIDIVVCNATWFVPALAKELEAEVASKITPEQQERFKRFAEADDICTIMDGLRDLRWHLRPMLGVLEAGKEDQLADFNAEDFRRMEKEDEVHKRRRQKEKDLSSETSE